MRSLSRKKVLVTGGAGFIGSHIVDRLMNEDAEVTVLDDLSNGSKENIERWLENDRLNLVIGDIRQQDTVKEAHKDVTLVFHQAARVSVPYSARYPCLVMDVNVQGTAVLLDESRRQDIEKVVVASSSSVYGDTPTLPKVETMPTKPLSPYAVSKLAAENMTMAFHETYGMNTTALRYFNVYGPRQRGGAYAGVINIFGNQALSGEPLTIDGDGQQTRDFTYIDDVVQCNIKAATRAQSKGQVYNVGGGSRITILELAETVKELTESESELTFQPPRPGDVHDSLAGIEKAQQELGYGPQFDIEKGLQKTIEWMRE